MGAQSETQCQKTSSVAGARGIACLDDELYYHIDERLTLKGRTEIEAFV